MSQVKRLGMGLGALIGGAEADVKPPSADASSSVEVALIRPNPFQPRGEFDDEEIDRLAASIKRQGLLQPVVVRAIPGGFFELVAGERRWRAAKKVGLEKIPSIIRQVDDRRMLELALVENIQRKDLNPMEKARAFRQLMQLNRWTQEQVADAMGLGRPTVANFLRLLDAPLEVQEAVSRGTISMGHARALLAASQKSVMLQMLAKVLKEELSVRALEQLMSRKPSARAEMTGKSTTKAPYLQELELKLMDRVGVKVEILPEAIVIPYGSNEQLTLILRRLDVM